MKKTVKYIIVMGFFATLWQCEVAAWSWWFNRQPKTAKELQADFEKQQINDPTNPYVNYNLGVAAYKNGEYVVAEKNFARAVTHATDPKLKEQGYFNAGNALYKAALGVLGEKWEKSNVEDAVLDNAIALASQAITRYESVLVLKSDHERALTNKAVCEELLRELQEKKRWQHEKRPDNKDEQSSDKNKQQGDADNKQQQKSGGNNSDNDSRGDDAAQKETSDASGKEQREKKDGKPEKQDQKSGKQENDDTAADKKDAASERKQDAEREKQEQAESAMNKEQQKKEEAAARQQQAASAAEKEKEAQEEQAIGESLRDGAEEQGEAMQGAEPAPQQDSATMKSYKVLLNRLDEQEANRQKGRLQEKSKGASVGASRNSQQKPW